jgi:hypothetical protein
MDNTSRTVLMIGAAVLAGGLMEGAALAQSAPAAPASPYPSPEWPTCISKSATDCRLPDGHPDLTGLWAANGPSVGGGGGTLASGATQQDFPGRGGSFVGHEADGGLYRETVVDSAKPAIVIPGQDNSVVRNVPDYKPQYWNQIVQNDYNGNFEDPAQDCLPNGVPRLGAPAAIVAIPGPWVQLIYATADSAGIKIRMVPTDGRPHNVTNVAAETWDGDPVGHWEGDTLVIETVGFTDASWLHKNGYIHGFDMKVTEKLTRNGNKLTWQATVDDPEYLAKPWNLTPVVRNLATDPNASLYEALPCSDIDHLHTTSHVRSG